MNRTVVGGTPVRGSAFGAYAAKAVGTEYLAATDGIVIVINDSSASGAEWIGEIRADPTSPAVTARAITHTKYAVPTDDTLTLPVPKGYSWKVVEIVTVGSPTITVYWMPVS